MSSPNAIDYKPQTLKDLGLTRDQSSTFQKLAAIPAPEFERRIAALTSNLETLTTKKVLAVPKPHDVAGYPGIVTLGSSPNTLTFGDWSQLCLLEYGVLEIGTDPFGASRDLFRSGRVGIRCIWTVDSVLLNPSSFCISGGLN